MENEISTVGRHSLLLVEDDAISRINLVTIIQAKLPGIELLVAEDGNTGLELYKKHTPQIVIADIKLPMIDGIRLASEILALNPATNIIVITAHNNMQYLLDAMKMGISRYVLKPIDHKL